MSSLRPAGYTAAASTPAITTTSAPAPSTARTKASSARLNLLRNDSPRLHLSARSGADIRSNTDRLPPLVSVVEPGGRRWTLTDWATTRNERAFRPRLRNFTDAPTPKGRDIILCGALGDAPESWECACSPISSCSSSRRSRGSTSRRPPRQDPEVVEAEGGTVERFLAVMGPWEYFAIIGIRSRGRVPRRRQDREARWVRTETLQIGIHQQALSALAPASSKERGGRPVAASPFDGGSPCYLASSRVRSDDDAPQRRPWLLVEAAIASPASSPDRGTALRRSGPGRRHPRTSLSPYSREMVPRVEKSRASQRTFPASAAFRARP